MVWYGHIRPLRRLRRHLSQMERQVMRSTGGVSLPLQKATRPVGENQIVLDENRLPCGYRNVGAAPLDESIPLTANLGKSAYSY